MTTHAAAPPQRPADPSRVVPVRHPGRWVGVAVIVVLLAMLAHTLVTNENFQWSFMADQMFTGPVVRGAGVTVVLTVTSMVVGIVLGVVIGVMRLSVNPVLSATALVWSWFFRAIPRFVLLTVLGVIGLLYPRLGLGVPFGSQLVHLFGGHGGLTFASVSSNDFFRGFKVGLIGLGLSESGYMAEIVRAGIMSVDTGQLEAAESVGMSPTLAMRRVVLPQAMRIIVPPTGNEVIAMLKDTSLVVAVPVSTELFFQLQAIGNRTFQIFPMLVAAVLWYLALSSVLLVGQHFLERRFGRGFGVAASGPPPSSALLSSGLEHH